MNDWNIQSRAHACQECEASFKDKQPYHTLLLDEKNEYRRLDVCPACFESRYQGAEGRPNNCIYYWQGIYQAPPAAPPEAIQKESAETLLRKLMELNDPRYAAASFILAVMLERKRLLKVKEQFKREGQRIFIYEQPRTGDLFTIPDPDLQLDQLDEVQRDVANLLQNGLPQPEGAVPDAPPVESSQDAAAEMPPEPDDASPVNEAPAPTKS